MAADEIEISTIGRVARDLLLQNRQAVITGLTRRGVFLRFPDEWVTFLSSERYCGPLTLNAASFSPASASLQPGDPARIDKDCLVFDRLGLTVRWRAATVWEAPELPATWQPAWERQARLMELTHRLLSDTQPGGLICCLPGLWDWPVTETCTDANSKDLDQVRRILQVLAARPVDFTEQMTAALAPFLGRGGGLTPSGDDLILGLLLALNRWGRRLYPDLELSQLNQMICSVARSRTTGLSASLIDCATSGQADERLVSTLERCLVGEWDLEVCSHALRSWGNTSGVDAFVGMAIGLCISSK